MTDAFSQIWDEASQSYIGSDGAERVHTGQLRDEQSPSPHPPIEAIERLKEAAEKATPGDLDSAEIVTVGEILCPLCGDGTIDHKAFTNIDGQAIGVEVFGVGQKMADYERFARLANPAFILSFISSYEERGREIERLRGEPENDTWWKTVIGETHEPSGEKVSIKHLHPLTVKPIYEAHKGTAVADVIAGLIFEAAITRNREKFLVDDVNQRATRVQASLSQAQDRIRGLREALTAVHISRAWLDLPNETKALIDAALSTPKGSDEA